MAGIKISALPSVASPALTDIMPEVQPALGGVTYKVSFLQLLSLFQANIQITESQVTNLVTDLAGKVNKAGDSMTGFLILNADPVLPLGAATKQYVDNIAAGLNVLQACYAASNIDVQGTYNNGAAGVGATLTNASILGNFTLDGVAPPFGSRILIKDQTNTFENGIYALTTVGTVVIPWVLTRAGDYDQPSEINPGDLVLINNGTVNAHTAWVETATVTTIGVDPILWTQFGGVILPLAVASGGTGATTAAGARSNLGAAASGANADITSMTGLTGSLKAPTAIIDANGNSYFNFISNPSAVNSINVHNSPTNFSPTMDPVGPDATISMGLGHKGGFVFIKDTTNVGGGKLYFDNAASSHGVSLTCDPLQATDPVFQLPGVDGSANTVLKTNGSGILSFANVGTLTTKPTIQTFSSGSGTYTTPANVTYIHIRCWGAGGGSGGATSGAGQSGAAGGGGGGGYVEHIITSPAGTYSYAVGTGGTAGAAGNNAGGTGGATTFSTLTANGGQPGTGSAGVGAGPNTAGGGGNGGTASGGNLVNIRGTNGSPGVVWSASTGISGNGGAPGIGSGANGASSTTVGLAGISPGGGASGGASINNGGAIAGAAGSNGLIIVEEYYA